MLVALAIALGSNVESAASAASALGDSNGTQQRPLRLNDVFEVESIAAPVFSPDGEALAFVKQRSYNSLRAYRLPADGFEWSRSEIWVQEASGKPAHNLVDSDGFGRWQPQWSPDGRHLAFLSNRSGAVQLWLWERTSNRLRQLTTAGLEDEATFSWVDNQRLLYSVVEPRTHRAIYPAPAAAEDVTASPLHSGVAPELSSLGQRHWLLVDILKRISTSVVSLPHDRWSAGPSPRPRVAPGGKLLAFARVAQTDVPNAEQRRYADRVFRYTVDLRFIDGRAPKLDRPLPLHVLPGTMQWSQNGQILTFLVRAPEAETQSWRVNVKEGRVETVAAEGEFKQDDADRREAQRIEHKGHKPAPQAELLAISTDERSAVYELKDRNGIIVWRVDVSSGQAEVVLRANAFLSNITEAEFRSIEFTTLDGDTRHAWLMLPIGYRAGIKYPLLVHVRQETQLVSFKENNSLRNLHKHSLQIPAALGYAVLFPDMYIQKDIQEDRWLKIPNAVLPAVDKVVTLGIADPDRLFVAGQSYGGYDVYGLVEQTRRFKAGLAAAGPANLFSFYGSFQAQYRFSADPSGGIGGLSTRALAETGFNSGGRLPWENIQGYLRNSPIFWVERIATPLMIVQGDLDYVPMQQGEEIFSALMRQGKRAQFLRYWGEGHAISQPENVRDLWKRTFAWFEEFGDISRDASGNLLFEGERVRSRRGTRTLQPEDYAKFDFFAGADGK